MSVETVISRIYRMREAGIISEYRLCVNPALFGMETAIIVAEAHSSSHKQKNIRALRTLDRATSIVESTGKVYTLSVLFTDERDMRAQMDAVKAKIIPSRIVSVLRPHNVRISPVNLPRRDWQIIEYLMDDPRASEYKMSLNMGIDKKTIERRLERLITGGIVKPTVVVQPGMFEGMISYRLFAYFSGNVEDTYKDMAPGLKNQWHMITLESPGGVVADIYSNDLKEARDNMAAIKGIDGVKDAMYIVPSRVISNDSLIKRKVIDILYHSDIAMKR